MRLYTLQRLIIVVLLIIALAGPFVAPGLIAPFLPTQPESAAAANMRRVPFTDVDPYGANFFLQLEVEDWKKDRTLEMAHDAGIVWVKQHFPWEDIETSKGVYWNQIENNSSWTKYDNIVDRAEKYGMHIIARLDRPPAWTRKDKTQPPEAPPDDYATFGDFVYQVVNRYKGRITYYQIWNEPNIWTEWSSNQPVNPRAYVELLKVAYTRAKQADPNAVILSAPLAMTLEPPGSPFGMNELLYLEQMYQAGAKDYFDILCANAFGFSDPPEAPASPDRLNFQRVTLQRNIMEKYGDAAKPIWFNEFGWDSPPANMPSENLLWGRVSEEQQADYTARAIKLARSQWPWAGVFSIWYFRQVGNISPDRADYYFAMVNVGFTPRPVYYSIKVAAAGERTAQTGFHEESNGAVEIAGGGRWKPILDKHASGNMALEGTVPGSSLTIQFEGTGLDLLVTKSPQGGHLQVSIDDRPANLLPGDGDLNLSASSEVWQQRIQVATGLVPGTHKARLTVPSHVDTGNDTRSIVDGFIVTDSSSALPPSWTYTTLPAGILLLGSGVLAVVRRRFAKKQSLGRE